jgi:hypothetical protein
MSEIIVHVQFVDEKTGNIFGETHAPLSSLPQSFEAATHLELESQHWDVVTADPITAEGFARSGQLVLTLRRAPMTQVKLQDVLYSLPTIGDMIPGIAPGTSKLNRRVFEFHEDNWRQIELISLAHLSDIQAELSDIRRIYEESAVGHGFRTLHVRKRIAAPLSIPFPALLTAFDPVQSYEGIAYERAAGLIEGGFGFETAGFMFFGEQHQNSVRALCVAFAREKHDKEAFSDQLKLLMESHELILVDWCRCAVFQATTLARFLANTEP